MTHSTAYTRSVAPHHPEIVAAFVRANKRGIFLSTRASAKSKSNSLVNSGRFVSYCSKSSRRVWSTSNLPRPLMLAFKLIKYIHQKRTANPIHITTSPIPSHSRARPTSPLPSNTSPNCPTQPYPRPSTTPQHPRSTDYPAADPSAAGGLLTACWTVCTRDSSAQRSGASDRFRRL